MFCCFKKFSVLILAGLIIVSCSNNIRLSKSKNTIREINKYNSKGIFIKTHYEKFNIKTNKWYFANCKNTDYSNTRGNICDFTITSLRQIKIDIQNLSKNDLNNPGSQFINNNNEPEDNNNQPEDNNGNDLLPGFNEPWECEGGPEKC